MIRVPLMLLLTIGVLSMNGCPKQFAEPGLVNSIPGFFSGLVHGWITFFSFIGSLFSDTIRFYAFPNEGVLYDFGWLIGAGMIGASFKDLVTGTITLVASAKKN